MAKLARMLKIDQSRDERNRLVNDICNYLTKFFHENMNISGGVLFGSLLNSDRTPSDIDILLLLSDVDGVMSTHDHGVLPQIITKLDHGLYDRFGLCSDISPKAASALAWPGTALNTFHMGNVVDRGIFFCGKRSARHNHTIPLSVDEVRFRLTASDLIDYARRLLLHQPNSRAIIRNSVLVLGYYASFVAGSMFGLAENEPYQFIDGHLGMQGILLRLVHELWNINDGNVPRPILVEIVRWGEGVLSAMYIDNRQEYIVQSTKELALLISSFKKRKHE